jgi:pSer/pThr/pTyr-binding forkhead associated (FHA) protein
VFDVIAGMTGTGSASRFVGFTITGLAIGIAVGLIEEFRKVYWLTVLTGRKEGRSYILTRPNTILGRDELADVPLFGDATIQKQHASILLGPTGATLVTRQGAQALVNGAYLPQITLQDGDVIEFGRHRLRFNQRAETGTVPQMATADPRSSVPTAYGYTGQPTSLAPGTGGAVSRVTAVQGPHAGAVFVLTNGAILGRDERCDIALIGDIRLSRQHARFVLEGTSWVVEDGNSTNGLYVNGVRVGKHLLVSGDQVSAGETVLHVS